MSRQDFAGPLRALYEAYIAKAEQLERDRKPGQGIFGIPGGPKDDPCHEQFAADVQALLDDMVSQRPTSAQAREALAYIYRAPREHREPQTVYWMLQAVHGLTVPLAALLDRADAKALRDEYVKMYRRWERLPAMNQALAALDRRRS